MQNTMQYLFPETLFLTKQRGAQAKSNQMHYMPQLEGELTPMSAAAYRGRAEVVAMELLLEYKVDPDETTHGCTALMNAAHCHSQRPPAHVVTYAEEGGGARTCRTSTT